MRAHLSPTDTRNLGLISLPDHDHRINIVTPLTEPGLPRTKEIVVGARLAGLVRTQEGDYVTVETGDNKLRALKVVGTAYFMTLPPPSFAGQGYGFASLDTLEWRPADNTTSCKSSSIVTS